LLARHTVHFIYTSAEEVPRQSPKVLARFHDAEEVLDPTLLGFLSAGEGFLAEITSSLDGLRPSLVSCKVTFLAHGPADAERSNEVRHGS
jgi:hypothetical protein